MNDDAPMTFRRALRASEFWLLVVAATAAMSGVPWWVTVPLVVAALSVSSLPKYTDLWSRAREVGAEWEWWKTVGLSAFNSISAACGAHVLGIATRWLWF